jgi:hypothetical protein
MIVFGDIDRLDENTAKVKVSEHENAVYDCHILQPLTGKNKIDFPFAEGDQVCVFLADERNVILGAIYNEKDTRDSDAGDDTFVLKSKKIHAKADDLFQFGNGDNAGLVKVAELTQKLNNLEQKVNELLTTLSAITITLAPTGTVPFAPFFSSVTQLTQTQKTDLENEKVKH